MANELDVNYIGIAYRNNGEKKVQLYKPNPKAGDNMDAYMLANMSVVSETRMVFSKMVYANNFRKIISPTFYANQDLYVYAGDIKPVEVSSQSAISYAESALRDLRSSNDQSREFQIKYIDTMVNTINVINKNKDRVDATTGGSILNTVSYGEPQGGFTVNNPDLQTHVAKYYNTFGAPFVYLDSTDKCYYKDEIIGTHIPKIGRSQLGTIYSNPAVFSICPGKVTYMPGVAKKKKDSVTQKIQDSFSEAAKYIDSSEYSGTDGALGEQLYEFICDYNDYINRLNGLARVASIMIGIGDRPMPYAKNGEKYREFDYGYYTTANRGNQSSDSAKGGTVIDKLFWQLETGLKSTFNDDQYIHFFISNEGTTMSETATVETEASPLASTLDNDHLNETIRSLQFVMGGAMNQGGIAEELGKDLNELRNKMAEAGDDSIIKSLMGTLGGLAAGGRLIVPDMISGANFRQSTSCVLYFRSLTGDPEDVFLRVLLPSLAILNFALPKQLANNMYGYPYVVKCYQRGIYNSDLAVIGNVDIERGGSDNISWSESGIPTEIKVSFSITPLHESLMAGNGRNPFLFMDNGPLLEYIGNLCGIDLNVSQFATKWELFNNLLGNYFGDGFTVAGRTISGAIKNRIQKIFTFN